MNTEIIGLDKEEDEDILRCLSNLYNTIEGSIPLDRDFGIGISALDQIDEESESLYSLEIMEKTDKYEPRVAVTEVEYEHNTDGSMKATVIVEKRADRWQTS